MQADGEPLLRVQNLTYHLPIRAGWRLRQVGAIRLIDGLSFDLFPGETLALVGEVGCGKSLTGRLIMQLIAPTGGHIGWRGQDVSQLSRGEMRQFRQAVQITFQNPYNALNPTLSVGQLVGEPLVVHQLGRPSTWEARIAQLLQQVGLNPYAARRAPSDFSGMQRQRISLARALASNPQLLILDDPFAVLDTAVHRQMESLLLELQAKLGLTYLLLTRQVAAAQRLSQRIGVIHAGQIVEMMDTAVLAHHPLHPYTQALLRPHSPLPPSPDPTNLPTGCRFHPRCPYATDLCRRQEPTWRDLGTAVSPHFVSCHHATQSG